MRGLLQSGGLIAMLVVGSACRAAAVARPRQILLGSGQGMRNHRGSRVGNLPPARGGGEWAGTQCMCSPTDGARGWHKMAFQHGGVKIRGARPSLSTSPKIRLASITQHLLPAGGQSLLRTARSRGAVEQLVGQGSLTRSLVASLRGGGDAAETGEKAVADLEARFGSFAKLIEECEDGGQGWKDLQDRMRNAAGEMIELCKIGAPEPRVQQRGAMIVFEGLDKSGKSTQVSMLAERLDAQHRGSCRVVRFPDRTTPLGKLIDMFLRSGREVDDKTLHIMFAANRWQASADLRKSLQGGTTLLVDRYSFSGVAYSGAKGLDREWCLTFEEGLPAPDMVVFLDIDPGVAALRDEYGGERFEKVEFQGLVRSGFQQLRGDSWLWVDATRDKAEISAELLGAVAKCIEAHCTSPVREM